MEEKSVMTTVRLSPDARRTLDRLAKQMTRTRSDVLRLLLVKAAPLLLTDNDDQKEIETWHSPLR